MKAQKYLLFLLTICLPALLLACSHFQTGISRPAVPAASQLLAQLNLTPTPQPHPPAVKVVDSPVLDRFVPHMPFVLQFNQPMNPASAPSPLQITPALNGNFTWNKTLTRLTFTPSHGFTPGKSYVLALDDALKTATGLPFAGRRRWQIRVLAEPRLTEQIVLDAGPDSVRPQPKSFRFDSVTVESRRPTLKLTFDRSMDPDSVALALSVQPSLPLKLRWQETTLFIEPALALDPDSTYQFSLSPTATDRNGITLAVKERWSIRTPAVVEKVTHPTPSNPQAPIAVHFNYPLAKTGLNQALTITPTVAGEPAWNRLQTTAVLTPAEPLPPDTNYTLIFTDPLLDANGDKLPSPEPFSFTTPPVISRTAPTGQDVYPDRPVTVKFSRPMDQAATAAAFQITPPISGTLSWEENRLTFQPEDGYLAGETAYTVTIRPMARDAAGRPVLSHPYTWSFHTGQFRDLAGFGWGPKVQVVNADGGRAVQFQAGSIEGTVPTFTFELYRLDQTQLVEQYTAALKDDWFNAGYQADTEMLTPAKRWTGSITETSHAMQSLRQVTIPPDVLPGPYLLNINTGPHTHAQLLLLLTRHTLVIKAGDRQVVTWVTGLDGQPAPGLEVTLFDADGQRLSRGRTDANGVYRTTVPPDASPHLIVAGNGLDLTAGGLNYQLRSLGDRRAWWWWGSSSVQTAPHSAAHIYTDRPIYRPGQTVSYKAIIRRDEDARLDILPADSPVTVRIRDSRNNVVQTAVLSTSHFGTVHGDFHLAEGAMLGEYAVEVSLDNDTHRQIFKVEDYRKPDYQVSLSSNATKFVQGETVEVTLEAGYFLGEPVAGADVTVQLYQLGERGYWEIGDSEGYVWYQGRRLATAEQTNAEGRLSFSFEAEMGTYSHSRQGNLVRSLWAIEATVDDGSHQAVSSFQVIEVYNRPEQITLQTETHFHRPGQIATLQIEAQTIFGEPLAGRALAYSVSRSGRPEVKSGSLTTDDTGQATLPLLLEKDGYYIVRVKQAGDKYQENGTSTYLYAYNDSYARWYGQVQNVALSMHGDQDSYAPGDTAHLMVASSFSGPALLTVERGTTRREQMVELTEPVTLLEVPIRADDVPNIYVTLNAWQPLDPTDPALEDTVNRPESQLHRAKLNLSVPARDKALTVTITPDKAVYRPRQEAAVTVRVTNSRGRPVSAEVSLALVDEAIFALSAEPAGSIFDAFYYPRRHRVRTYDALAARRYWDNGLGGGGGGGGDLVGNPRRDFPDTAAWFPVLHTDANGEAHVTLTLPDSLTGWRLTAKATTADTQVGESFTTIRTHQEIVARPILPGGLTAGDQIELSALVHNYSDSRREITVSLAERPEAGDCPDSDTQAPAGNDSVPCRPLSKLVLTGSVTRTVTLAPGALAVIGWPVSVLEAGQTQIFVRADSGGETRDAVQLPLSIRPLAIPEVTVQVGQVTGEWVTTVSKADEALPQSTVRLELSRSIAGTLLDGLEYLTGFPYGCVEQTMSRTLPTAVVGRAFHRLGVSSPTAEADLPAKINAGLQRLYGFQHEDGGWGWWHDDRTHDYQTAWVVFGLAVIREAGYEVDEGVTNRGVTWLNKNLEEMDPRTRAYALYSMAVAGQPNLTATLTLADQPAGLDTFSRAGLALALAEAGRIREAQKIVDRLAETAVRKNGQVYWLEGEQDGHYHRKTMASTTRSTALALSALTRISPGHELEPGLVRWLMNQRGQQGWGTTNETAYAVLALTDHLLTTGFSEGAADSDYTVRLNGEIFAAGRLNRAEPAVKLEIPAEWLVTGPNKLQVSHKGKIPLYYVLSNRTYLAQEQIKPAGQVKVRRTYRHPETKRPVSDITSGQLVEIELAVNLPDNTTYVILEDLLPGGLEALNERLNTTSHAATAYDQPRLYWRDYGYNHKEIHPGRVSFFMTELDPGPHTFTYLARATHSGRFVALPAELYAMYDLSVWGRSGSSQVSVVP